QARTARHALPAPAHRTPARGTATILKRAGVAELRSPRPRSCRRGNRGTRCRARGRGWWANRPASLLSAPPRSGSPGQALPCQRCGWALRVRSGWMRMCACAVPLTSVRLGFVRPCQRLTLESSPFRVSPGCVANACVSLLVQFGAPRGGMRVTVGCCLGAGRAGMQVRYERCASIGVGKDEIAVAVRVPGDGPDGRITHKRTFGTFYGVLRETAGWLSSFGVSHVSMEATGIYSMPVYHALVEFGDFEQVLVCNAGHMKNVPGRKTDFADAEWQGPLLEGGPLRGGAIPRAARAAA